MQQSPVRVSMSLNLYHRRIARRKVAGVGYCTIVGCNCCTLKYGHHRQWQKRLSKQITLRSHRAKQVEVCNL